MESKKAIPLSSASAVLANLAAMAGPVLILVFMVSFSFLMLVATQRVPIGMAAGCRGELQVERGNATDWASEMLAQSSASGSLELVACHAPINSSE
jgi:fatty acid desaturase